MRNQLALIAVPVDGRVAIEKRSTGGRDASPDAELEEVVTGQGSNVIISAAVAAAAQQ